MLYHPAYELIFMDCAGKKYTSLLSLAPPSIAGVYHPCLLPHPNLIGDWEKQLSYPSGSHSRCLFTQCAGISPVPDSSLFFHTNSHSSFDRHPSGDSVQPRLPDAAFRPVGFRRQNHTPNPEQYAIRVYVYAVYVDHFANSYRCVLLRLATYASCIPVFYTKKSLYLKNNSERFGKATMEMYVSHRTICQRLPDVRGP